ncbi:MAG: hypothetical protein QOJ39_1206 [Candidatus Eremiobacteraeota bacterium]|jgi:hypothetical protein|nr:hypothetical protein [Candidatus Eremiobacteraeota bacterium]
MSVTRFAALSAAMLLGSGCTSSGSVTPAAAPRAQAPAFPAESSAARQILANVGRAGATARTPQGWTGGDDDDGGWSELQLPAIRPCGNGTYATDCAAWLWTTSPRGGRSGARSAESAAIGTPPVLNFCRDATTIPQDFTTADPVVTAGPAQFSLSYAGSKPAPIVTFATRWWNVGVQNSFAGNAVTAPAITVTPALGDAASRGWLVFFTWSWPADVLLVPYAINEIQVEAGSTPLAVPQRGSARLRAVDCLGRKIAAKRGGSGFGFSADLRSASFTSAASLLDLTVFGGPSPNGSIALSDDRGARTSVPVAAGIPAPGR